MVKTKNVNLGYRGPRTSQLSARDCNGGATMTTESNENGAVTLSRMNFSEYVGHVTIYLDAYSYMLFSSIGLGLGLDVMSGWLVVKRKYFTIFRCNCLSPTCSTSTSIGFSMFSIIKH